MIRPPQSPSCSCSISPTPRRPCAKGMPLLCQLCSQASAQLDLLLHRPWALRSPSPLPKSSFQNSVDTPGLRSRVLCREPTSFPSPKAASQVTFLISLFASLWAHVFSWLMLLAGQLLKNVRTCPVSCCMPLMTHGWHS